MTLIIATIEDGEAYIESDTLMTVVHPGLVGQDQNSLVNQLQPKVRLLNDGQYAVAFAGLDIGFYDVMRQIKTETSASVIKASLLEIHNTTLADGEGNATDFIFSSANPVEIWRICGGDIIQVTDICHIGDTTAFNSILHEQEKPVGARELPSRQEKISYEFDQLLTDNKFPYVGGVLIGVQSYAGRFSYLKRMFSSFQLCDNVEEWFDDIDGSTTDMVSFIPLEGGKLRICFPESNACYDFVESERGHMEPTRVD